MATHNKNGKQVKNRYATVISSASVNSLQHTNKYLLSTAVFLLVLLQLKVNLLRAR